MALLPCPNCRHLVSDKALRCPSCGTDLSKTSLAPSSAASHSDTPKPKSKTILFLLVVFLALVVVLAGVLLSKNKKQRTLQHAVDAELAAQQAFVDSISAVVISKVPDAKVLDVDKNGNALFLSETPEDKNFNNRLGENEDKVNTLFRYESERDLSTILVAANPATGQSTFVVDHGVNNKVRLSITDAKFVHHDTRVVFSCPMPDGYSAIMLCEIADHLVKTLATGSSFSLSDDNVVVVGALHEGSRQDISYDPATGWPVQ